MMLGKSAFDTLKAERGATVSEGFVWRADIPDESK
jgi:hypothetical protein